MQINIVILSELHKREYIRYAIFGELCGTWSVGWCCCHRYYILTGIIISVTMKQMNRRSEKNGAPYAILRMNNSVRHPKQAT